MKHSTNLDTDSALLPLQANQQRRRRQSQTLIGSVASLGITVSNPPTQAEVQAIANKVDALLSALRASGLQAP